MPAPAAGLARCRTSRRRHPGRRRRQGADGVDRGGAGRRALRPCAVLNGINHNEELDLRRRARLPGERRQVRPGARTPVTPDNYEREIAAVLGVSRHARGGDRGRVPARRVPGSAPAAFSTLVSDADFACPALQVDRWTSRRVPTFAYEFDDDTAPHVFTPPGFLPPVATHGAELQYLFDLPNAPFPRRSTPTRSARGQHARRLGKLRRERQPGVTGSALAVVRGRARACCRSCRRNPSRDGTSPRRTTARSGPPDERPGRTTTVVLTRAPPRLRLSSRRGTRRTAARPRGGCGRAGRRSSPLPPPRRRA